MLKVKAGVSHKEWLIEKLKKVRTFKGNILKPLLKKIGICQKPF